MTLNEIIMQLVLLEEHPAMPKGFQSTFQKVIESISEMPEIIRCKDCKHWEIHKRLDIPWCRCLHSDMGADDYCSYAELRGDSDG